MKSKLETKISVTYYLQEYLKKRGKKVQVQDVWKHDKDVLKGMKKQGYKVLVVWESELKDELDKTTKKILKFAKS